MGGRSQLLYGHAPLTHTSMKENEGLLKVRWMPQEGEKSELKLEKADKAATPALEVSHVAVWCGPTFKC